MAKTPGDAEAVEPEAHRLRLPLDDRLRRQHVLDLGGADAPGQRSHPAVAGGVTVPAHQRASGQRDAELGPDHVDDALPRVVDVEMGDPELLAVAAPHPDERQTGGVGVVGAIRTGGNDVVDHRERELRASHRDAAAPQPVEAPVARHLVHQVAVDVDEHGAVAEIGDDVVVPDPVEQRAGSRRACRARVSHRWSGSSSRRPRRRGYWPVQDSAPRRQWSIRRSTQASTPLKTMARSISTTRAVIDPVMS